MSGYEVLNELGYIKQKTPAGRVLFVNPAFYPLSDEQLAQEDDYADDWATEDAGMDRYDDWSDIDMGDY